MNLKTTPLIITILLLVFSTAFIVIKQPELHKQTIITDSKSIFVEEIEEETKTINTTQQAVIKQQPVNVVKKTNPQQKVNLNIQQPQKPTATKKVQTTKINTKTKTTPIKVENKQTTKKTETKIQQIPTPKAKEVEIKPQQQSTKELPVQIETPKRETVQPEPQTKQTKVLTEQEEIIVWNKWRSDLQNQVMRDTKILAPHGTGFKFSFTVDKYGNMSNIKVWSTNSVYTDLAVRVIKPVLQSYQHKPILNFPNGTRRVITNVTGGFVIATKTQYSSPSDYSDYETVKTTR